MLAEYYDGADVVAGSRYMKGGKLIGGPPFKQFLSRMSGLSLHWLRGLPTHDATNAFKIYDGAMVRGFSIESTGGFELNLELAVKAFLAGRHHRRSSGELARPHRRKIELQAVAMAAKIFALVFLRVSAAYRSQSGSIHLKNKHRVVQIGLEWVVP